MQSRIAAAVLATSLAVLPARADEHTSYHLLEPLPDTSQPCRPGMLLNLPASWQSGDGAVVLLAMNQPRDATHDMLVSALLFEEHAAVLELAPRTCDAASDGQNDLTAAAIDALEAMTRQIGSGMAVAIGYGPGARAVLDVVHAAAPRPSGGNGPRYAAAVALGDGAPAFALGAPLPPREGAPLRLALLCRALAAMVGGMGETPERAAPADAAAACTKIMAADNLPVAAPVRATAHR